MIERPHTCQCCGRAILANSGVIAHHGYQRPAGWQQQIGTCMGSRFAPYEASRDRLGVLIGIIERELAGHRQRANDIETETVPLQFIYSNGRDLADRRYVETTRADFDDVRAAYKFEMTCCGIKFFDDLKKKAADQTARQIIRTESELADQRKRFAGWKEIERWSGTEWQVLPRKRASA